MANNQGLPPLPPVPGTPPGSESRPLPPVPGTSSGALPPLPRIPAPQQSAVHPAPPTPAAKPLLPKSAPVVAPNTKEPAVTAAPPKSGAIMITGGIILAALIGTGGMLWHKQDAKLEEIRLAQEKLQRETAAQAESVAQEKTSQAQAAEETLKAQQKKIDELASQLAKAKSEQELASAIASNEQKNPDTLQPSVNVSQATETALPVLQLASIDAYKYLPLRQAESYIGMMLKASTQSDALKCAQAANEIAQLAKPSRGDRQRARVLNDQGLALLKSNNWERALDAFNRAAVLDPMDREIAGNLGFSLDKVGLWNESRTANIASLTIEPTQATSWGGLGIALAKLGHEEEAIASFRLAYHYSNYKDKTYAYFQGLAQNDENENVRNTAGKAVSFMATEQY